MTEFSYQFISDREHKLDLIKEQRADKDGGNRWLVREHYNDKSSSFWNTRSGNFKDGGTLDFEKSEAEARTYFKKRSKVLFPEVFN